MSFLLPLPPPRNLRLFVGETGLAGYSEVVPRSRGWTYQNAYGLRVGSTRFEELWVTPRAIRTLVLELQPGSRAWTSCLPEDCRRVGQFCSAGGLGQARPYCPLSIS